MRAIFFKDNSSHKLPNALWGVTSEVLLTAEMWEYSFLKESTVETVSGLDDQFSQTIKLKANPNYVNMLFILDLIISQQGYL